MEDDMKTYEELEKQYAEISEKVDELFGCEYGGILPDFLDDLLKFAEYTNGIVEDSKSVGTYDAVMHKRDKEELESFRKENKRLHRLASVGIAVKYLRNVSDISDEPISGYGSRIRQQANDQLQDQVKYFLDTFKQDEEDG